MESQLFGRNENTVLYVYLPSQFIGYFVWKENLRQEGGGQVVQAKKLSPKGWGLLRVSLGLGPIAGGLLTDAFGWEASFWLNVPVCVAAIVATALFVPESRAPRPRRLDPAGQLLMILRYREQWILWIALNILSIVLWAENPSMYLMFGAYLLNSVYGFYNWSRLQKATA